MGKRWLILGLTVMVTGCGGSSPTTEGGSNPATEENLTAEENFQVAKAESAFYATILNGSQYRETLQGVEDLVRICRAKPDARYDGLNGEVTMRQVLEDDAARLARYRGELSDRLAAVAAAGCK